MRTLSWLPVVVALAFAVAGCGGEAARRDANSPTTNNHDPDARRSMR